MWRARNKNITSKDRLKIHTSSKFERRPFSQKITEEVALQLRSGHLERRLERRSTMFCYSRTCQGVFFHQVLNSS